MVKQLSLESRPILVIEDDALTLRSVQSILENDGYQVLAADTGKKALDYLGESIRMVLLDLHLPDLDGLEVLGEIKRHRPEVLVIIMTAYGTIEGAVKAMKIGAYDYIEKPVTADSLRLIVKLALETQALQVQVERLMEFSDEADEFKIIGSSQQIRGVLRQVAEVAKHPDLTVLVQGESGTGKELICRAIHSQAIKSMHSFLAINAPSLPETLFESELFGYEKGSFTDAKSTKRGLIEQAEKGTLLLDEIGDMPLGLQAKVLRVIEDKKFRRIGGTRELRVDVRIVAATNKNLQEAIARGTFRADLYYRLKAFDILVPPLRARKDDIPLLAMHFVKKLSKKRGKEPIDFSAASMELFIQYNWPGNVRELKNAVERLMIMFPGAVICPEYLPHEIRYFERPLGGQHELARVGELSYDFAIEQFSRDLIKRALISGNGSVKKASKLLGLPRSTLRYQISRLGLQDSCQTSFHGENRSLSS